MANVFLVFRLENQSLLLGCQFPSLADTLLFVFVASRSSAVPVHWDPVGMHLALRNNRRQNFIFTGSGMSN